MDVLISGAGIAGPNLAWWLARAGYKVTIVERAPQLRTGGYIIDFWGKGYDLAEHMGLMKQIEEVGYHVREVRFVGAGGRRMGGFPVSVFARATRGRFVSLPRGELSRALFEAVEDRVETIFGDSIASLEQDADGVSVGFGGGAARRFDMVVGAEGIRSRTRDLVFGPQDRFERFLACSFAAYLLDDYPLRQPDVYVMYGEPGRQAARFALRDGSTLVLLMWRDDGGKPIPHDLAGQASLLRERFRGAGWEVPDFLAALDSGRDLYVDRMSQIEMDRWHEGRIALVGDAAFAPSLLAGQGSALAMIGGYVLAGELGRYAGDIPAAFAAYERRLMDFMRSKQKAARSMQASFVPKTGMGLVVRAVASRLLNIGGVANFVIGRTLRDQVALPDYR